MWRKGPQAKYWWLERIQSQMLPFLKGTLQMVLSFIIPSDMDPPVSGGSGVAPWKDAWLSGAFELSGFWADFFFLINHVPAVSFTTGRKHEPDGGTLKVCPTGRQVEKRATPSSHIPSARIQLRVTGLHLEKHCFPFLSRDLQMGLSPKCFWTLPLWPIRLCPFIKSYSSFYSEQKKSTGVLTRSANNI